MPNKASPVSFGVGPASESHPRGCIVLASRGEGAKRVRMFNVVVERDPDTGIYVGHVPGWPGAHSQGASLDELQDNLREVVEMLLEDGDPELESEFVGVQTIHVA